MNTTFSILMHTIIILVSIYYIIKYNNQKKSIEALTSINDAMSSVYLDRISNLKNEIKKLKKLDTLTPQDNISLKEESNNVKKAKKSKRTKNEQIS